MKKFNQKLNEHFLQMCSKGKLFRVVITGREFYEFMKNKHNEYKKAKERES
jgi:hypothetical protein